MEPCNSIRITWQCNSVVASKSCELAMQHVLHRKGEWGRGRDLPPKRLDEISQAAEKQGMTLYQALSLRRGLLRSFNMRRFVQSSAMGTQAGQQDVATMFEEAVESFLRKETGNKSGIFLTENELMAEMKAGKRPMGPTPDILFLQEVEINGCTVKWLDAKQYYASAMLANKKKIPNGKLLNQALRYNNHYGGQGAFVFARGYCAELATIVPCALLLDATPLDMSKIEAYQEASM